MRPDLCMVVTSWLILVVGTLSKKETCVWKLPKPYQGYALHLKPKTKEHKRIWNQRNQKEPNGRMQAIKASTHIVKAR